LAQYRRQPSLQAAGSTGSVRNASSTPFSHLLHTREINMFGNYPAKRLCDVVFPGTHDAGVYGTELGATARTQTLNLGEQAAAGVRYFDLRIATVKTASGALEERAYHAPELKDKTSAAGNHQKPHLFAGLTLGLTGIGQDRLSDMLLQAKNFVKAKPTEFLILRFSKCGNMQKVADDCVAMLGAYHFNQNVNLNEAVLSTLAGRVITVFDQGDFNQFPVHLKQTQGILPVKSLFGDKKQKIPHGDYNPHMWGLQYFGKYSNTGSHTGNLKKQVATLAEGPTSSPELLGMMYWTLTTKLGEWGHLNPLKSIQERDRAMWDSGRSALESTWRAGLKDHIIARAGHMHRQWQRKGYPPAGVARSAKSFMPNIIMMDFAESFRCTTIWNLNYTNDYTMGLMADDLTNVDRLTVRHS